MYIAKKVTSQKKKSRNKSYSLCASHWLAYIVKKVKNKACKKKLWISVRDKIKGIELRSAVKVHAQDFKYPIAKDG